MAKNKVLISELGVRDIGEDYLNVLENLSHLGGLTIKKAKKVFQKISENPGQSVFVAKDEKGVIVGTISVAVHYGFVHNGARVGYVYDLATLSGDWQKKTCAAKLAKTAIAWLLKARCRQVLATSYSWEAFEFYQSIGFQKHEEACLPLFFRPRR